MMRRENLRGLLDAMSRGDVRIHVVVLSGTDGPVARKRGRLKERLSTFTDSHDEYIYSKVRITVTTTFRKCFNKTPFRVRPQKRKNSFFRKVCVVQNASQQKS